MKIAVFSAREHDQEFLGRAAAGIALEWDFFEPRMTAETAPLAAGYEVVCLFVHDVADAGVIGSLAAGGTRLIALRCAGYNNVDLARCRDHNIAVVRVAAYSPHAVAEHATGMILELNRKFHRAYNRIRDNNFSLEGLLGFDIFGKTVGVIGTGRIGSCFARIMLGFGCRVLAHDISHNTELERLGAVYTDMDTLLRDSDIISLHCPLTGGTHHLVDGGAIDRMKAGVMLINTSRGPLVDTDAVIAGIKSGWIGYLGLDVYEEEEGVFYEDLSTQIIDDDRLMRLTTFPNVLITSHQAFFTGEALDNIARTTVQNILDWQSGRASENLVEPPSA